MMTAPGASSVVPNGMVPDLRVRVLESVAEVGEFWDWLTRPGREPWIACDTETTGLDWMHPEFRVRLIQFGDTEGGWAIRFADWRGLVDAVFLWCAQHRVEIIFHNCTFDMNALWSQGVDVDWSLVGDTFFLAGITGFADHPRGLKEIGRRRYGNWASAGDKILKNGMRRNGWTWADIPFGWQAYPMYAVVDTCLTAMIWREAQPSQQQWRAQHDLEVAAAEIMSVMMRRGVMLDGPYLAMAITEWEQRRDSLAADLLALGVASPSRNAEVSTILRRDGIALPKTPAGTGWSTKKDVLEDVDHPVASLIIRWRFAQRMVTNYLRNLYDRLPDPHGRSLIHPSISPMEARTGRSSISDPPLHQIPRDDRTIRRAFVPRADDEALVTADYAQIEMRLFARLTRDEHMCAAFRDADASGGDFFVTVGRDVYNDPGFQKSDPRRTLMKNVSYGAIYSAGVGTMARSAKVAEAEMAPVVEAMRNRYPAMRTLGSNLVGMVEGGGWSMDSPSIGKRFQVLGNDEVRKLLNYTIQGTGAVILKRALVNARDAGLGDAMVLPVHDEILMSVPRRDAQEAGAALAAAMDAAVPDDGSGVRITAEPSIASENWADAK